MDQTNSYSFAGIPKSNTPNLSNLQRHEMRLQHMNSLRESLRRQKSISVPISHNRFAFDQGSIKSQQSTSPTNSANNWRNKEGGPQSFDSAIHLKRHQINQNLLPSNKFLQVNSPIRTSLPHQHSGESTESAVSCLSNVSEASPEFHPDCSITSTSEMACHSQSKDGHDKHGLWPSIKKMLKDKKPIFKKRKTEVSEVYMDPVYHLLKCGANPDHKPETCFCDCHSKSKVQRDNQYV